jgi:hypothetical protein
LLAFCSSWLWTAILLISASQVAGIIGKSSYAQVKNCLLMIIYPRFSHHLHYYFIVVVLGLGVWFKW